GPVWTPGNVTVPHE
nr:major outer membrane protein 31 kda subunit, MOMP 31 kda subunit [Legionella pneumophila, SVir Philadelphia 1, serogroup 1, Peptide Partial, 14 aa] [Legionella pneumophila]